MTDHPEMLLAPRPAPAPAPADAPVPETLTFEATPRPAAPVPVPRWWFWLGTLDNSPRNSWTVAGIEFPKTVETPTRDADGKTQRPVSRGAIIALSEQQLRTLAERAPHRFGRIVSGEPNEDGSRPSACVEFSVPTEAAMKDSAAEVAAGRLVRGLRKIDLRESDVAFVDCVFLVPLNEPPARRGVGAPTPPPLSQTGIVIPRGFRVAADGELPAAPKG